MLHAQNFDMTPYLSGPQRTDATGSLYDLIGVVKHSGGPFCFEFRVHDFFNSSHRNRLWPLHRTGAQPYVRPHWNYLCYQINHNTETESGTTATTPGARSSRNTCSRPPRHIVSSTRCVIST